MFLSPRTIDDHMRKVLAKLEIASRMDLAPMDLAPMDLALMELTGR